MTERDKEKKEVSIDIPKWSVQAPKWNVYFSVYIRQGKMFNGNLSLESWYQIKETARLLKKMGFRNNWPPVIYCNRSPQGRKTAELLGSLLRIKEIEINRSFGANRMIWWYERKMCNEMARLEREVRRVNIVVCSWRLMRFHLRKVFKKHWKRFNEEVKRCLTSIEPGQATVRKQHDNHFLFSDFFLFYFFPSQHSLCTLTYGERD